MINIEKLDPKVREEVLKLVTEAKKELSELKNLLLKNKIDQPIYSEPMQFADADELDNSAPTKTNNIMDMIKHIKWVNRLYQ